MKSLILCFLLERDYLVDSSSVLRGKLFIIAYAHLREGISTIIGYSTWNVNNKKITNRY